MSDYLDEMVFETLERKQVKVKIGGDRFVLLQASGANAASFRNEAIRRSTFTRSPDNSMGMVGQGLGDLEPLFLSWLLFYATEEGTLPLDAKGDPDLTKLVPIHVIKRFPAPVQKGLFNRAQEISDLNDQGEENEETLVRKLNEIQGKLTRLREGKQLVEASRLKNSQGATMDGSV